MGAGPKDRNHVSEYQISQCAGLPVVRDSRYHLQSTIKSKVTADTITLDQTWLTFIPYQFTYTGSKCETPQWMWRTKCNQVWTLCGMRQIIRPNHRDKRFDVNSLAWGNVQGETKKETPL